MKAITIYDVCKMQQGTMINEDSFCVTNESNTLTRVEQVDVHLTKEMNNLLGKRDHTLITLQPNQNSPTNTVYRCYFFDGDSLDYCRYHAFVFEQEFRNGFLYYQFNETESFYKLEIGYVERVKKEVQYHAYQKLFFDLVLHTPAFRLLHLTGSLNTDNERMGN